MLLHKQYWKQQQQQAHAGFKIFIPFNARLAKQEQLQFTQRLKDTIK